MHRSRYICFEYYCADTLSKRVLIRREMKDRATLWDLVFSVVQLAYANRLCSETSREASLAFPWMRQSRTMSNTRSTSSRCTLYTLELPHLLLCILVCLGSRIQENGLRSRFESFTCEPSSDKTLLSSTSWVQERLQRASVLVRHWPC
jgi:hypothetical protein